MMLVEFHSVMPVGNAGIESAGIVIRSDAILGVWIPALHAGITAMLDGIDNTQALP